MKLMLVCTLFLFVPCDHSTSFLALKDCLFSLPLLPAVAIKIVVYLTCFGVSSAAVLKQHRKMSLIFPTLNSKLHHNLMALLSALVDTFGWESLYINQEFT